MSVQVMFWEWDHQRLHTIPAAEVLKGLDISFEELAKAFRIWKAQGCGESCLWPLQRNKKYRSYLEIYYITEGRYQGQGHISRKRSWGNHMRHDSEFDRYYKFTREVSA